MYIYKITNKANNKVYIGQSIRPIEQRFSRHISDAMNNCLDTHFARAIRKYGPSCFVCEQIDVAKTQEELNSKEQQYIREYNSIENGYNETDAISKCGGNTYMSKSDEEMKEIAEKIRKSKLGSLNPNSKAIKVRNEETNEELFFQTVLDCQNYFGEKHHRFITTRVKGETNSLYKGIWNISYQNSEYRNLNKNKVRKGSVVNVINLESGEEAEYPSIRKMCEATGIDRSNVHKGENVTIDAYQITFK